MKAAGTINRIAMCLCVTLSLCFLTSAAQGDPSITLDKEPVQVWEGSPVVFTYAFENFADDWTKPKAILRWMELRILSTTPITA